MSQIPFDVPSTGAMIRRGLAKRCPRCGRGRVFRSWFSMNERCTTCNLAFQREDAHFVGAMAMNLVVTELLFGILLVSWIAATWPNPNWAAITAGGIGLNIVVPIVFYPTSKSLWTAIDLALHKMDPIDRGTIELP